MGIQYFDHSNYWMPIHYDTIKDGQNKISHLLFSKRLARLYESLTNQPTYLCGVIWYDCGDCAGSLVTVVFNVELVFMLLFIRLVLCFRMLVFRRSFSSLSFSFWMISWRCCCSCSKKGLTKWYLTIFTAARPRKSRPRKIPSNKVLYNKVF